MTLFDQVDLYCERIGPAFWAEPVNAWSNLGFLVAALLLRSQLRRMHNYRQHASPGVRALPALLALVGTASFGFHTFANVLTALADQLTILLFGCVFLYLFLREVVGAPRFVALATALAFAALSYLTPRWLDDGVLNQSSAYLPYLLGMLAMLAWLWQRKCPQRNLFAVGTLIFCVALVFRTIDILVCPRWSVGTHFVWHLLNSLMLFMVSLALAREASATTQPSAGNMA